MHEGEATHKWGASVPCDFTFDGVDVVDDDQSVEIRLMSKGRLVDTFHMQGTRSAWHDYGWADLLGVLQ